MPKLPQNSSTSAINIQSSTILASMSQNVEAAVYQISLTGVANPTTQLVMYSFSDTNATLKPGSPVTPVVYQTTEVPVITYPVKGSTPYVYTVANIANKLVITELISNATASLDINGPNGKYTVTFQATGIRIGDVSDFAVLSYGTQSGNFYTCTVTMPTLHIDVSNV